MIINPEAIRTLHIALEVCASIHREYAEGKDALFKTRQRDFVRHAKTAREAILEAVPEGYKPPAGLVEIIEEAADILSQEKPMRYPIVDELHGFAAMLAEAPKL